MDKEQELRPCPFCGSHELMVFCDPSEGADNSGPSRRIQCAGCNVEAPFYDTDVEAIAAWNRRSSDEQAEVVGWTDEAEIKALAEHGHGLINARRDEGAGFVVPLYRAPPAVAAGGVTEAQIKRAVDAALGEPENARRAADPDHPEADYAAGRVDAAQCVREALTSALAVGDEGMWENAFAEFEGVTAAELAATVARYGKALVAAKLWHEAEDKSLSKQPPTSGPNGSQWARLQHQEQIAEIDAALSPTPPSRGEGE